MLIAMAVHDTVENNRTWMTKATLESLADTVDWRAHRLIVSDNGSCRETQALYPSFRFVSVRHNGENIGTAAAINRAWKERGDGEHAVKMDNDVVIHQAGWVDWMEDVFKRDPTIGICGLKRKDLAESPHSDDERWKSVIRMLPHERGRRWLIVEEVNNVMGTCQAFSSALLDQIGYLTQPGVYGYDDVLASVRAKVAGYKRVFLHGFELDHIDPGGDAYCQWKRDEAAKGTEEFQTTRTMLEMGIESIYYDGGFSNEAAHV